MVAQSKSSADSTIHDHPATELIVGNEEQITNLLKLHPIKLPNDNIIEPQIEASRASYSYLYVVNWLYNCRGFIKLQSENFDIDLFEIELLNLVYPPPVDESVLFINKLKLSLISTLQSSKVSSVNNFEKIFRLWFGIDTPLKGTEDENEEDASLLPMFDDLIFGEKFEILYIIISYISRYPQFRTWIDKNGITNDFLRMNSIYTDNVAKGTIEDYFLLFDNSRLYKRTLTIPSLVIPKKRKLAPENPQEFFETSLFDVTDVKFEPIFRNIYEYNKTLAEIKKKKNKKNKAIYSKLSDISIIDSIFQGEIRKRKVLTNRKRELQLANLLATRKRSSRLEAKEKQKQEELREIKLQEEEELRIASERRLERRRLVKELLFPSASSTTLLSREERLKQRKLQSQEPSTNSFDSDSELVVAELNQDTEITDNHDLNIESSNILNKNIENPENHFDEPNELTSNSEQKEQFKLIDIDSNATVADIEGIDSNEDKVETEKEGLVHLY